MRVLANGRVKRTESEWRKIIEKFERSGLSQARFCEREGISHASFAKWRRKLHERSDVPAPFVEWAEPEPVSSPEMELLLPGGVVLRWKF